MASFLKKHANLNTSFLEYPIPVLIQSGGNFSTNKFQVESSDSQLVSSAIYINVCAKFSDMCAMASRTLLVNPKDDQKQAYLIANDALDTLIKSLKVGSPISDAYVAAKNLMDSRKDGL
jgi:nucleosome binding factor SPN SPT16 subunit